MTTRGNSSAAAAEEAAEQEDGFTLQVLNLISVARDIRSGRADDLAARIEEMLPAYLEVMEDFADSPLRTVTFYATGLLYMDSGSPVPERFERLIEEAKVKKSKVLSEGCFKEIRCKPAKGCKPWPTSLRAVDVSTPDPMGWRYVVGSHCGFHWPKFWKLSCGAPLGIEACTG